MQLLSLDDAGCTDIGHQREHNEDSFGIQTLIQKLENPMGRSVQARGYIFSGDGMGDMRREVPVAWRLSNPLLSRHWHDRMPAKKLCVRAYV
jgi:protein phosphatase